MKTIGPSTLRRMSPFYRGVLEAWLECSGQFVSGKWSIPEFRGSPSLGNLTARSAYAVLSDRQRIPHRCVEKFRHLDIDWPTVWRNLKSLRYNRPALDTCWLSAHGILPTADRLNERFGMQVAPGCHCGANETMVHLYGDCPLAHHLVGWFICLLVMYRPTATLPRTRELCFGYPRVENIPAGFVALLGLIRHRLWLDRNRFRFEGKRPVPRLSLERVKSSFRFLLRVQQRHCLTSTFEAQWLAGGELGTLHRDGSFSVVAELHSAQGPSGDE